MIKLLVKNRLLGFFSAILRKSEGKKKRIVLFSVLLAVAGVSLLASALSFSVTLGSVLISAGVSWLYFSIIIVAEFSILFFLSIFETKSELFDCKDNDLLLSMPIKASALLVSRLTVVLLLNYIAEAVILLPAAFVYAFISLDVVGTVGFVIVSLTIPLLATALASGVGYLVAIIMKKTGGSSLVSVIASLLFLVAYFAGYTSLMNGIEGFLLNFDPETVEGSMPVLEFIGRSASFDLIPFLTVVLVSCSLSVVACLVMSSKYVNVIGMNVGRSSVKYEARESRQKKPYVALTKKELAKFFSSATYMLNGGLGFILLVVAAVAILINSESLFYLAEYVVPMYKATHTVSAVIAAVPAVILSTVLISSASLSLEGGSIWLLKSLPVNGKTVMLSKLLPSLVISAPPIIVSGIILAIASEAPVYYLPFIFLTPLVAMVAFSSLGLIYNVLCPNFSFQNEAQPIKQSMAVTLCMFSQLLISLIGIAVTVGAVYFIGTLEAAILAFLYYTLLSVLFVSILFGSMSKRYESMSV